MVRKDGCPKSGSGGPAAQREVALTEITVIRRAKEQNSWKGRSLITAIAAEILAVLCLAIAVGAILVN